MGRLPIVLVVVGIILLIGAGFPGGEMAWGWDARGASRKWLPMHPFTSRLAGLLCLLLAFLSTRHGIDPLWFYLIGGLVMLLIMLSLLLGAGMARTGRE